MNYHYTRELGPEGQILTDDGDGPGILVSALLEEGPLPIRVALEIVANAADVLSIAEEDKAIHGDLKPGMLRIDEGGAVSIDGYGVPRRGGRAPEGTCVGISTDVYGLGTVLHALLSSESLGAVPRDRDGHDDAVVNRLMAIDWGELAVRKWLEDVIHFLCSMLAYDPAERPVPLDVANVLSQVAAQAGGADLATWAEGRFARRQTKAERAEEDLGGPETINTPMSQSSMFRIRQAASAKGEATAFWSRDKINALLAEDDDDDVPERKKEMGVRQRFDPAATRERPAATVPPLPDSTTGGDAPLPPPRRPDPTPPVRPPAPSPPVAPPPPVRAEPPPVAPVRPIAVQGPVAPPPTPFARPLPPEPVPVEPPRGSGTMKLAVGAIVLCGLGCLLAAGLSAVWYVLSERAPTVEEPPAPVVVETSPDKPPAREDTGAAPTATEKEPPPPPPEATKTRSTKTSSAKSTSGSGAGSRTTSGSTSKSTSTAKSGSSSTASTTGSESAGTSTKSSTTSSSSSSSKSSGASSAGSFPATVKITVQGKEANLQCGDGTRATFVGSTRQTFSDVTTCRISVGEAKGVLQVTRSADFTCAENGSAVTCSGG